MKKKKSPDKAKKEVGVEGIHCCTEMALLPSQVGSAISAAIKERPDNLVLPQFMTHSSLASATHALNGISAPAIAVVTKKLWAKGKTLRVRFLDAPSALVKKKIEQYAHEWEKHANVKFIFGDDPASEIRITCKPGIGSWSYLGTDALSIRKSEPTMNYGWFDDSTPDLEFSRTILHEFGHALGAIHEHQHPVAGIPWNRPVVYEYYKRTQGWSKADVDSQLFAKYNRTSLNMSAYDRKSIMHYPIDPALLLDAKAAVGWNLALSADDKAFMKKMYP